MVYSAARPRLISRADCWWLIASRTADYNYQETVYFFVAAILGCVQTGVKATLISDYATFFLLMRVLYIAVSYASMGKYFALGGMRTPIFMANIAALTQMLMLAQAAYAAPPVKKGFF